MTLRQFIAAAGLAASFASCVPAYGQANWQMPTRFTRPELASDEGGLWALMDRQEIQLRRSPFTLKDPELHDYVQGIACRLAGPHCPDVRVYVVRTPFFNANMAPNGMMQVWTGLMLRAENEAQLAAVLGHEIGHYLARHSVEGMRDAKSRSAFGQFLGVLGRVGSLGQLAVIASMFGYNRDQERQADAIGATLMREAGYDVAEAAKVWENLLLEIKARPGSDPSRTSAMFATHPSPIERQETLKRLAEANPGGTLNEEVWRAKTAPYMLDWLKEEVRRGQHEESLALLNRMIEHAPERAEFLYARGEVYRSRANSSDIDAALVDFQSAIKAVREPAETYRGLGVIYRQRNQAAAARESFQHYLEAAPQAPDSAMIKNYMEEPGT